MKSLFLHLPSFLDVLSLVFSENCNRASVETLSKFQVEFALTSLLQSIASTSAKESLYHLIDNPNLVEAKIQLKFKLQKLFQSKPKLEELAFVVKYNSNSLSNVSKVRIYSMVN